MHSDDRPLATTSFRRHDSLPCGGQVQNKQGYLYGLSIFSPPEDTRVTYDAAIESSFWSQDCGTPWGKRCDERLF